MAVDLSNIDISDLAGKVIVPEGNYLLLPVKAEDKVSSKGGDMVVVTFEIVEGDYEGVKLTHYFTWASEWGKKFCKMYADASDIDASLFGSDAIMTALPAIAKIEIEEGKPYINKDGDEMLGNDQNKINPFSWKSAK